MKTGDDNLYLYLLLACEVTRFPVLTQEAILAPERFQDDPALGIKDE